MGQKIPSGVLKQLVDGDHGETYEDAGKVADIDGEDIDVVWGAPALAISGIASQGFIFSDIVRRKKLEVQALSEGVIDTARPPQCEFSNLRIIPLTFYLEFLCWPVLDFH